ncbi:MAG: TauD/TfdA family dioxygenase [Pseudomonadales bacterium]|nr:TauD/TfdA family dioxygenase [Pseudomonadales bacterium]
MAETASAAEAAPLPTGWRLQRLAGALGAELEGVDLAAAGDSEVTAIRALLNEHQVLFFPDQDLSIDAHVAFGARFGELEGHPNLSYETPHPKIFELRASGGGVADEWHTDLTFQERPALLSVLYMAECPAVGGDTLWSNLCAAFDAMSAPLREFCEGLTALHDALPHNRPDRMAIHPVVRVHPETGRRALYVNEHFTRRLVELEATESDALLRHLVRWIQQPRFTVRYRWRRGTVAIWDNRATQHFVVNDFEGERVIRRVTVTGDVVEGTRPPAWEPWVREGRLSATSRHDRQLFMFLKQRAAGGGEG